jgi:WD40 repeat protein
LLHGHAERVTAVALSPNSKTLATGGTDRVIRLWDVETGKLRATLWAVPSPDPDAAPTDWVAFTPDGHFAGTERGRAFLRFAPRPPSRFAACGSTLLLRQCPPPPNFIAPTRCELS